MAPREITESCPGRLLIGYKASDMGGTDSTSTSTSRLAKCADSLPSLTSGHVRTSPQYPKLGTGPRPPFLLTRCLTDTTTVAPTALPAQVHARSPLLHCTRCRFEAAQSSGRAAVRCASRRPCRETHRSRARTPRLFSSRYRSWKPSHPSRRAASSRRRRRWRTCSKRASKRTSARYVTAVVLCRQGS